MIQLTKNEIRNIVKKQVRINVREDELLPMNILMLL
ncbi:hypothetical protein N173_19580 [Acinetobacter baumannii EGD-HP18]|uniref:Uncharacterized protein n=1 Tax=Acinetobacter baumannii EGD-HP18 TaxID=1358412 RepID=A0AAV3JXT0_ACIBA|nr:hypothetical protein N173_19580 [Acinetobacter baumannii EGD-HP18]